VRALLHRSFEVAAPVERVWDRLARPAQWPSWAHHIEAVRMTPAGLVTASSAGEIRLRNGIVSRFEVTEFQDGARWLWTGPFLWMRVRYDHVLTPVGPGRTRVAFDVAGSGFGVSTLGRLFARVYARNLDRAIPNLVAELERPAAD
jgi:carbon monoxide dehydrogenase subunit G